MGMFSGIGAARPTQDGNYVNPGNYVCRINRVKKGNNRAGGEFIVAEMTVLHVISTDPPFPAHTVGEDVSQMFCKYGGGIDFFLKDMKAFAACAFSCDVAE